MDHKVVINSCIGCFTLSVEAVELGRKLSGNIHWAGTILPWEQPAHTTGCFGDDYVFVDETHPRHDPVLIAVVEQLGSRASGVGSDLRVVVIEGDRYWIEDHDGRETIHTPRSIPWIIIRP